MRFLVIFMFTIPTLVPAVHAQESKNQTIISFTSGMQKFAGYFDFYWDNNTGKIFLEVDKLNTEFLYVNALAAGVGSNDIGLDRGQLGDESVVKFERYGPKVLLVEPNQHYRAVSDNVEEVRSVNEAFASSILAGFLVEVDDEDRLLIDITDFIMRDSHLISRRLKDRKQGNYKLDPLRSSVYMPSTMNFPENTEFEAILTFSGTPEGDWIRSVVPNPQAVTVRTHHSFIKLPDDNYSTRTFDPRSGFNYIAYQDYATPIDEPLVKRMIRRHRLEKKNPNADISEAVEPIIYYVDRGAPEPIRSALIEGASWWNQAFEAAGYKNAFRVKVLPEGVHPLDVRYNVIQWVHRSTRGWSYGASVVDPRTGEIIKGHVSLGSLRVRQDFLIATGLLNPYKNANSSTVPMKAMALARLRQLSAHEVGHTIGLSHNFAASYNDRASVMDYPHPYVQMDKNGNIDLSEAYDVGIGEWDKVTIKYGYGQFGSDREAKKVLDQAFQDGFKYITDQDARPMDGAHPLAHLWDNGKDAVDELNRMMDIRRKVLNDFSEAAIKNDMPYSSIEEVLVPMYLFHRYQIDGASKLVGGLDYSYAVKGSDTEATSFIKPKRQIKAVDALISTIKPEALRLSEDLLLKLPPKAHGYSRSRETFPSNTGIVFDYFAAIKVASSLPVSFLLNPGRCNRLVMFKARNTKQPGLTVMMDRLIENTWNAPSENSSDREIQKIVEMVLVDHLMQLYVHKTAIPQVKAKSRSALMDIVSIAGDKAINDPAYYEYAIELIEAFLDDPQEYEAPEPLKAPDGSPIGSCNYYSGYIY
ncbi:MAG TPA: zinc-dependent metalloprotease [Cyclobacteriaceae bacterium]